LALADDVLAASADWLNHLGHRVSLDIADVVVVETVGTVHLEFGHTASGLAEGDTTPAIVLTPRARGLVTDTAVPAICNSDAESGSSLDVELGVAAVSTASGVVADSLTDVPTTSVVEGDSVGCESARGSERDSGGKNTGDREHCN
jgi:hypothetical protein